MSKAQGGLDAGDVDFESVSTSKLGSCKEHGGKSTGGCALITEVVKIFFLVILILAVIGVGGIFLGGKLLGLEKHEHKDVDTLKEVVIENERRLNKLEVEMATCKNEMTTMKEQIDKLMECSDCNPITEDQCLERYDSSRYADGVCYFRIGLLPAGMHWTDPAAVGATWFEARDMCRSMNATLAYPHSDDQWHAIWEMTRGYAWLGFRQVPSDGPWTDMEGVDVDAIIAQKLDTDHLYWSANSGEDCAVAYPGPWPRFFRDRPCDFKDNFIFFCQL